MTAQSSKTVLITGIAGQDGSLLVELLLSKGYTVCGTVRNLSFGGLSRIRHREGRVQFVAGDLLDQNMYGPTPPSCARPKPPRLSATYQKSGPHWAGCRKQASASWCA